MKEMFKKYWYVIIILVCLILMGYIYDSSENEESVVEIKSETIVEKELVETVDTKVVNNYFVDIKGEVKKPGVYEIESDKRIIDVINKAGGLTKNADTSLLNLSRKITDEMNIKVYSKKEVQAARDSIKKEPEVIEIIKEIEKECVCPDVNYTCENKNDAVIEKEDIVSNNKAEDKENSKTDNKLEESNTTIIDKNDDSNTQNNIKLININTATKEELMSVPNIGESKANSIIEYRKINTFNKIEDILNVSGIGESIFAKIKEYITV